MPSKTRCGPATGIPPPQADCGRLRRSKRRPRKAAAHKPKPAETPAKAKAKPKVDPDKLTIEHKKLVRRAMLDAFRAISIDQIKEAYPKLKPLNDSALASSALAKQLVRRVRLPRRLQGTV